MGLEISGKKTGAYYESLLLITTLTWSMSFIWSKTVTNTGMDSGVYLFLRYTLAFLLLLPFSAKKFRRMTARQFKTGVMMGCIVFGGMIFQTCGIALTTPSNSSFITTAYVVIAPFTTWLLMKKKPQKHIYAAVGLCLVGIYILNMKPGEIISLNLGNALTLLGAVGWAFQLTYTSVAGEYMDPILLSALNFGVTGLGGLLYSAVSGGLASITAQQLSGAWQAIVLAAVFPTIVANVIQVYAQHNVDANKAAVIYTLEAVFATFISVLMGFESWSLSVIAGGGIIFCAVLVAQLGGRRKNV